MIKTQGRRGEVAVELHSDVPGRFHPGMRLWALAVDDTRRQLQIEELWSHKGSLVLKFKEVASISEAEALAGCELQLPREQRAQLEAGWNYISDLVGCVVYKGDRSVGRIEDVRFGAGEAPLLVVRAGSKEYEIPYAEAYVRGIDLERKQVRMALPEGMLDVNAPLNEDEKQQQRRTRR